MHSLSPGPLHTGTVSLCPLAKVAVKDGLSLFSVQGSEEPIRASFGLCSQQWGDLPPPRQKSPEPEEKERVGQVPEQIG